MIVTGTHPEYWSTAMLDALCEGKVGPPGAPRSTYGRGLGGAEPVQCV